jgi:hypothetical protein
MDVNWDFLNEQIFNVPNDQQIADAKKKADQKVIDDRYTQNSKASYGEFRDQNRTKNISKNPNPNYKPQPLMGTIKQDVRAGVNRLRNMDGKTQAKLAGGAAVVGLGAYLWNRNRNKAAYNAADGSQMEGLLALENFEVLSEMLFR